MLYNFKDMQPGIYNLKNRKEDGLFETKIGTSIFKGYKENKGKDTKSEG